MVVAADRRKTLARVRTSMRAPGGQTPDPRLDEDPLRWVSENGPLLSEHAQSRDTPRRPSPASRLKRQHQQAGPRRRDRPIVRCLPQSRSGHSIRRSLPPGRQLRPNPPRASPPLGRGRRAPQGPSAGAGPARFVRFIQPDANGLSPRTPPPSASPPTRTAASRSRFIELVPTHHRGPVCREVGRTWLLLPPIRSRHDRRDRDAWSAMAAQLCLGAARTHAFAVEMRSRRAHAFIRRAWAAVGESGARIRWDREVSRVLDRRGSDARMGTSAVTGSRPGRSRIAKGNAGSHKRHRA
jgi:hypothetical protein